MTATPVDAVGTATPSGTVSIDVDPLDAHLAGYGRDAAPDSADPAYGRALPRLLEALAAREVRATFFVVARDAATQAGRLRAVHEAGHEVASHSTSHPVGLASLPEPALREELAGSKARLEDVLGTPVEGFRAPGFDLSERVVEELARAGYRYDASLFPSPLLLAAGAWLALRRRRLRPRPRGPLAWRRGPHLRRTLPGTDRGAGAETLAEFPLTVTPTLRLPVYHTSRYALGEGRFERLLARQARRGEPLSYILHAVDALGLEEDCVDRRLAAHPGMGRSLAAKRALLDGTLGRIAARFRLRPFRERLAAGELGAPRARPR